MTVALLSACSGLPAFDSPWGWSNQPAPSDRFLLPPEGEDVVGKVQVTTAQYSDTLLDIARRYDLGYEEIVAANPGVDVWLPGEGTRVILPTQFVLPDAPREGLVLNLAAMRLFYFPEPEAGERAVVITHPMGIGREGWQTPEGVMTITHKKEKPAWTVPESVRAEHAAAGKPLPAIMPSGPDNPLGDYAMRLSDPLYLIHGTNQPHGVGLRVSHGCVRLYPEDIARLFPEVPVGTRVRIINQPYMAGWRKGRLYLEAHQPLAEQAQRWGNSLQPMKAVVAAKGAAAVDWNHAEKVARAAMGIPFPVSPGGPDIEDVLNKASHVPSNPPWVVADNTER
ncbi:MAG: L,D-transpeptidase family protein [Thiogranum sp.]|nr:L,D-transpeptidase family protein [Thiogranum sp.]